jgi:AraC-like DNA-binding protein
MPNESEIAEPQKICIATYVDDKNMEHPDHFLRFVTKSLTLEYFAGDKQRMWRPHKDHEWRTLPFTSIVYMGDSNSEYYALIKDAKKNRIGKNCCAVFPAGTTHKLELLQNAPLSYCYISFTVLDQIDLLSLFNVPLIITEDQGLQIGSILNDLADCHAGLLEQGSLNIPGLVTLKQHAFRLLQIILSVSTLIYNGDKQFMNIRRISEVLDFIHKNMTADMTRKILADMINLSETRFHYVFKEIMGVSPMDYLITTRMRRAQHLLLFTDLSITEIAGAIGLNDVFYFSKQFKSYYHVSPLKYRQMYRPG